MTKHADQEALSAYVDGEAPEWADHVAGCPACGASAEALRAVSAAVGAPVAPPPAAVREAALAAALGGAGTDRRDVTGRAPPGRRGIQAWWTVGAVAAMVLVVLGVAAMLSTSGRSSGGRTDTVAGPAFESAPAAGAGGRSAADSAAPTAPVTDLGDVSDAATLLARARPSLGAKSAATSGAPAPTSGGAASPASGAAAAAGPAASGTAPAAPAAGGGTLAPNAVGTRPCEAQARARQPSLGQVVYFATARRQGVPAVVLGFSTGPDPAPVTLLMLAQDGCGELLRAVGP